MLHTRVQSLQEKWLFSPQISVSNGSWAGLDFALKSLCYVVFYLAWACSDLMHIVTNTASSDVYLSPCVWKTLILHLHPPSVSYNPFTPSSAMISESWEEGMWYKCLIQAWEFCNYFLHLDQLWVSMLIAIYYKRELPWWGWKASLI